MDTIQLVRPGATHKEQAMEYIREHTAAGEHELHGASLLGELPTYEDWLAHLEKTANNATVAPGWVPASTFFALRQNNGALVGTLDIRHTLNDFLRSYGGLLAMAYAPASAKKVMPGSCCALALPTAKAKSVFPNWRNDQSQ